MKTKYDFLPFRFNHNVDKYLLANDVGDYCFLNEETFHAFVSKNMDIDSQEFQDLQSKYMAYSDSLPLIVDVLATRYRTKKQYLYDFTSLHMFVVTHRCNNNCTYCHASSDSGSNSIQHDMTIETAQKCVDLAFQSPSSNIKIECQGGEPLLAFNIIKFIVEYSNKLNEIAKKNVSYVVCTNLTHISSEQIEFIDKNNICVSTSLDGPADIHDKCRKSKNGLETYDAVVDNIKTVRDICGTDKISALTTVTPYNLYNLSEVVDDYLKLGLTSIFLRMINPYGYAIRNWSEMGYSINEFVDNYKKTLDYIIEVNLSGRFFPEEFATILLTKILTPFSTGFVDLQSPTGAGINGVIYDINGDVFMADEARMLAKMSETKEFCLGNVYSNSWHDMFCGNQIRDVVESSCIESLPGCAWCVYQPYCGNDPLRNFIQYGHNFKGNSSRTEFCQKHKAIFNILFDYLSLDNDDINNVFWSWITRRNLSTIITENYTT